MSKRYRIWLLLAALLVGGVWAWRAVGRLGHQPLPQHLDEDGRCADLPSDLKLMWETGPMEWVADPARRTNRASTDQAIQAASRVFNTVELIGKTREEVIASLGDPKTASDSIYNFPFWPAPSGSLVYRFDTGAYGWQFNVVFGFRGRVTEVERHWIH
jgi:hypothetical protein